MDDQVHKPHRKSKEKKGHSGPNPKAFSFSNPGKLQRAAARSHDIKEKRLHVPLVDRLPEEKPPKLVTIVGPPGVGKTTLLKSLIRRYAKETISDPQGPITVVTSKKQRLTFIECPNEMEAMVDLAKVADIVLLMIDGNYGFEMETMEILNILAAVGMPGNVFGILTHLDLFRKPQQLKDAKKRLKRRLWSELYQGAHLFYLSGIINGRYPDREVHNLSRFLSVMKNPRPLVWRNSHPYAVIDSYRDVTHPTKVEEDGKCDRSVMLSGYLRGTNFAYENQRIHVPGLGDFTVKKMEVLPDPCPTPAMEQAIAKATGKTGRRRLDEKDKKLYAPMSDRSGLKIDGDAIYIYREKGFNFDKDAQDVERGEGEELIIGLQSERKLLGQMNEGVKLFANSEQQVKATDEGDTGRKTQRRVRFAERDDESEGDEDVSEDEGFVDGDFDEASGEDEEFNEEKLGKLFRKDAEKEGKEDDIAFADSDSDLGSLSGQEDGELHDEDDDFDSDEEESFATKWKENMVERASKLHSKRRPFQPADLARMLYDDTIPLEDVLKRWKGDEHEDLDEEMGDGDDEGLDEDEFFKRANKEKEEDLTEDRSVPLFDYQELDSYWSNEDHMDELRSRFTSANLLGEDGADAEGDSEDGEEEEDEDDEGDGEFEDLETGEKHGPTTPAPPAESLEEERERNARRKEELRLRFEEEDREGLKNDKAIARREGGDDQEFGEDEWYDAQKALLQKQLDINKAEYEELDERQRVQVEGFRAGSYCQLLVENVPAEFVKKFNTRMPLIVGGLTPTEDRFGFVQVRIKRHRWHKKILKTGDPLIFSLGWRRFQTMPIYSISDSRTRNRLLKYTPEHMHCFASFYGPLIAPNTGFVCFNSLSASNPGFRIAATGTVLSVDESVEVVKKLKLTGTPAKIFKNTAFIKGMFNTALEVAKFEGASIKTVSGVRGQIKHALSRPEGQFRATFEDRILLSDIVILRAWYPVKPHRFYNPVTNLIGWQPMRLTGEVRRDQGIPTPLDRNSQYRKVERATRRFNPLKVPRALAAALPFRSQIVVTKPKPRGKETYLQKRAVVLGGEEKKARDLMQKLTTIRKDAAERRAAKKGERRAEHGKKVQQMEEQKQEREKRETKQYWSREGKKRKQGTDGGGGGKRRK
ncbi:Ribosome biogenesis protein bms1 [Pleurostoma richardsiae]|uniref:Ribosome biogenesis protein bms1 n=1 Tax=Pleurostoma richardsiae TaxID=41990 RepID=A0AA38RUX3_9PEZI|nr:Ribosome biogenesis protein bms1 [Pleurostoma richardsiae]